MIVVTAAAIESQANRVSDFRSIVVFVVAVIIVLLSHDIILSGMYHFCVISNNYL